MTIVIGPKTPTGKAKKASKRKVEKIDVNLLGIDYKVNKLKAATALRFARAMSSPSTSELEAAGMLDNLVQRMFGTDAEKIFERLEDPEDELDFEHIGELAYAIFSYDSDKGDDSNPTG